jgi:hypothetical protein
LVSESTSRLNKTRYFDTTLIRKPIHTVKANPPHQSKHFSSIHQLIGLLLIIILLLQLALGLLHHRTHKKQPKSASLPTSTKYLKIHKYLGPTIFLLGLINGGLGFNFAGNPSYNARYTIMILMVAVCYSGIRGIAWWWAGRKRRNEEKQQQQEWVGEGFQHPQFGPQESYPGYAVPLREMPGTG